MTFPGFLEMKRQLHPRDEGSLGGDVAPVPVPRALSMLDKSGVGHLPRNCPMGICGGAA